MKRRKQGPSQRKVEDLKDKARQDSNRSTPSTGKTSQTVLYGPHNDTQRAYGAGEYDQ